MSMFGITIILDLWRDIYVKTSNYYWSIEGLNKYSVVHLWNKYLRESALWSMLYQISLLNFVITNISSRFKRKKKRKRQVLKIRVLICTSHFLITSPLNHIRDAQSTTPLCMIDGVHISLTGVHITSLQIKSTYSLVSWHITYIWNRLKGIILYKFQDD